jgi:hypothetical protein
LAVLVEEASLNCQEDSQSLMVVQHESVEIERGIADAVCARLKKERRRDLV